MKLNQRIEKELEIHTPTWGEFEHDIMVEIMTWTLDNQYKFKSVRDMINAFWRERLE